MAKSPPSQKKPLVLYIFVYAMVAFLVIGMLSLSVGPQTTAPTPTPDIFVK